MDALPNNVITLLQYLLPGFLAAWVFFGLTAYVRPSQFERVIQALIFTLLIQVLGILETSFLEAVPDQVWRQLYLPIANAFLLGVILAWMANEDIVHVIARKVGITSETAYASGWFGAFKKYTTYVVLHLNDERRVYGWPEVWPSEPDRGHFILVQADWLHATMNLNQPMYMLSQ